ncbi:MAG: hypothetical protein H0U92_12760, partial [Actinobacteria bacterium]|nr:hypothetical protein [Actinomycetota bacterium]
MEPSEGADDEVDRGWVHPDDRLWRHPSEMGTPGGGGGGGAVPETPRVKVPNVFAIASLAGVIGALMTAGLIAAIGGFNGRVQPVRSIERVAASTVLKASSSSTT